MAKDLDINAVNADYQALFVGESPAVSMLANDYDSEITEAEVREFLTVRGMSLTNAPADAFVRYYSRLLGWKTKRQKMKQPPKRII